MKCTFNLVVFTVLLTTAATAQGGWHHRHQYYSAYPATYAAYPVQAMPFVAGAFPMQMPAAQLQLQLSSADMQALAGHVAAAQAAQAAAAQPAQSTIDDLRKLVGDLQDKLIDGNTTEEGDGGLSQVKKDLAQLRKSLTARVDELDETVELHAKHLVTIHEELKALKVKISGKTPDSVKKALDSEGFKTTLQGLLKPEVKVDDALKSLRDKLENLLE